jgi:hypothetical protein
MLALNMAPTSLKMGVLDNVINLSDLLVWFGSKSLFLYNKSV